jgi:hypothetical protein
MARATLIWAVLVWAVPRLLIVVEAALRHARRRHSF